MEIIYAPDKEQPIWFRYSLNPHNKKIKLKIGEMK